MHNTCRGSCILTALFFLSVAGLSDNAKLLGTDAESAALVDQWSNFADEEIFNYTAAIFRMVMGMSPYVT
jgi:elongation factor 1-gamma